MAEYRSSNGDSVLDREGGRIGWSSTESCRRAGNELGGVLWLEAGESGRAVCRARWSVLWEAKRGEFVERMSRQRMGVEFAAPGRVLMVYEGTSEKMRDDPMEESREDNVERRAVETEWRPRKVLMAA